MLFDFPSLAICWLLLIMLQKPELLKSGCLQFIKVLLHLAAGCCPDIQVLHIWFDNFTVEHLLAFCVFVAFPKLLICCFTLCGIGVY